MKKHNLRTTVTVLVLTALAIWLTFTICLFVFLVVLRTNAAYSGTPQEFEEIVNAILLFGSWTPSTHFLVFTTGFWGTVLRIIYIILVFGLFDVTVYKMVSHLTKKYWHHLNKWLDDLADDKDDFPPR